MTRQPVQIVDVWAHNLEREFERIQELIPSYPVIAMDTEFPGEIYRSVPSSSRVQNYERLRKNVNQLKLIQLGITLGTDQGEFPEGTTTWQFNFKFNPAEDRCAPSSISLLLKAGFDFDQFSKQGIDVHRFAELLTTSGLVLTDSITWLTFHSNSDFAYLVKILTNVPLPPSETQFLSLARTFFPSAYDLKLVAQTRRSLNFLANELAVPRVGQMHQAGSDSLLTFKVYHRVINIFNGGSFHVEGKCGKFGGLNEENIVLYESLEKFWLATKRLKTSRRNYDKSAEDGLDSTDDSTISSFNEEESKAEFLEKIGAYTPDMAFLPFVGSQGPFMGGCNQFAPMGMSDGSGYDSMVMQAVMMGGGQTVSSSPPVPITYSSQASPEEEVRAVPSEIPRHTAVYPPPPSSMVGIHHPVITFDSTGTPTSVSSQMYHADIHFSRPSHAQPSLCTSMHPYPTPSFSPVTGMGNGQMHPAMAPQGHPAFPPGPNFIPQINSPSAIPPPMYYLQPQRSLPQIPHNQMAHFQKSSTLTPLALPFVPAPTSLSHWSSPQQHLQPVGDTRIQPLES